MKKLAIIFAFSLLFPLSGILDFTTGSFAGTPNDFPFGAITGGITNTPHNLGSTGAFTSTNDTSEVCVFCHTPHNGTTVQPLWNRESTSGFKVYGTTMAGTTVTDDTLSPSSLACLSCHDGVTSFDTLINAPGKGGGAGAVDLGWTFRDSNSNIVSDMITTQSSVIGTNLWDDHPISVTYREKVASLRPKNTVISSIEMTGGALTAAIASDGSSRTTTSNRWALKGFVSSDATIEDILRGGKVECSTCHDPHFKNTSWDEVESTWGSETEVTGLFLRRIGGNSVSGVCRTCHNK